jgi:hypothetical protein
LFNFCFKRIYIFFWEMKLGSGILLFSWKILVRKKSDFVRSNKFSIRDFFLPVAWCFIQKLMDGLNKTNTLRSFYEDIKIITFVQKMEINLWWQFIDNWKLTNFVFNIFIDEQFTESFNNLWWKVFLNQKWNFHPFCSKPNKVNIKSHDVTPSILIFFL